MQTYDLKSGSAGTVEKRFEQALAEHGKHLATTREGQHDLSRIAARSYPYLMILDQDSWLAIQKDEEANLALSPEEAELLDSIHRAGVEGELGYPLFINGRAGSGKSTMLQYLAAARACASARLLGSILRRGARFHPGRIGYHLPAICVCAPLSSA